MSAKRLPFGEWGFGIAGGRRYARVGFARWIWLIEWDWPRTPTFQRGGDGYLPQWLIPIPFATVKPWLLITWTWPPSVDRI